MQLTENRDLRGGRPCWIAKSDDALHADGAPPTETDIAIIGSGIMGAMLADRLAKAGRRLTLFDRRPPAHGSTAASTALVMWAADVPLTQLAEKIGDTEAARRWRRNHDVLRRLAERIERENIDCARIDRPELYLAGTLLDESALRREGDARQKAGLPCEFLTGDQVAGRFGIAARAALLCGGSYEVDPVKLTLGLLERARTRGATLHFPVDIERIEQNEVGILLHGVEGERIQARHVILAGGYERATLFLPEAFTVGSSYAIASAPGVAPQWNENAMIWEASSPYLYARTTADGRVIAGGEDEDFEDAQQRDALIGEKSGTLRAKLEAMVGGEIAVDCAWAAAFGSSPDGLPAIGAVRDYPGLWLANGFGGNGVTFAALGAELIGAAFDGTPDIDAACFDPYRFQD